MKSAMKGLFTHTVRIDVDGSPGNRSEGKFVATIVRSSEQLVVK